MTVTSRVPAVIDWLVNAAANSTSLGASPTAPVVIHDGPPPAEDTLAQPLHLYIGDDPLAMTLAAAEATQSWPVMDKARTKDEDGTVVCAADAWSGDTAMKVQRDACAAIMAAVELLLRGDGTTGPGDATMGGLVLWSGVEGPFTWDQRQTPEGAGCLCVFHVTYRARLTTS